MEEIEEVNLHVNDNQVFKVKKQLLCEHSNYFRALFSGNYMEKPRDVTIDLADANSMNIILKYMDLQAINLSEYTLGEICNLSMVASFLLITHLMNQIETYLNGLDIEPTVSNCMNIMDFTMHCSNTQLEHLAAGFALLSFKSMKPEYIRTIDRLFWYLSHPYLDTDIEIDVFKFGFDWISQTEYSADALIIILGCLDVKRLTLEDLKQMSALIKHHNNSLTEKVINCLEWLRNSGEITLETVATNRSILCETFTESVYTETYNIIKESKERKLKYTSVIQTKCFTNSMFTYTEEEGIENWLDIPQNLEGWNIAVWGNTKLVLVCGRRKGEVMFMRDVVIFDTLKQEWVNQGVRLPARCHAAVAVVDDLLYIVGGTTSMQMLRLAIVYNLKERTYKRIANSPEGRCSVHICSHKGSVYAATYPRRCFVYKSSGALDCWRQLEIIVKPYDDCIINALISFDDYIYSCSRNFVQRFRPDIDNSWERISLGYNAITLCSLILLIVRWWNGDSEISKTILRSDIFTSFGCPHDFLFTYLCYNKGGILFLNGKCKRLTTDCLMERIYWYSLEKQFSRIQNQPHSRNIITSDPYATKVLYTIYLSGRFSVYLCWISRHLCGSMYQDTIRTI